MPSEENPGQNPVQQSNTNQNQQPNVPEWVSDPQRAYTEIQNLRQESATRRTELNELRAQFEQLQAQLAPQQEEAPDEVDPGQQALSELQQLREQLAQQQQATMRAQVAARYADRLPEGTLETFMERLRGETLEEIEADAEAFMRLIPQADAEAAQTRRTGTTQNPAGPAVQETYAQRKERIFGRRNNTAFE